MRHLSHVENVEMVIKILFLKSTKCKLFNAVSTVSVAFLDQKLQRTRTKVTLEDLFNNGEIYLYVMVNDPYNRR